MLKKVCNVWILPPGCPSSDNDTLLGKQQVPELANVCVSVCAANHRVSDIPHRVLCYSHHGDNGWQEPLLHAYLGQRREFSSTQHLHYDLLYSAIINGFEL